MKVRLAGRMRQGPVRYPSVGLFDHRGDAKAPGLIGRQVGQVVEAERGMQVIAIAVRSGLDLRCMDHVRDRSAAAVADEPIGRPLRRGRQVELVVCAAGRSPDESLEAGMLPKSVGPRR